MQPSWSQSLTSVSMKSNSVKIPWHLAETDKIILIIDRCRSRESSNARTWSASLNQINRGHLRLSKGQLMKMCHVFEDHTNFRMPFHQLFRYSMCCVCVCGNMLQTPSDFVLYSLPVPVCLDHSFQPAMNLVFRSADRHSQFPHDPSTFGTYALQIRQLVEDIALKTFDTDTHRRGATKRPAGNT